MKTSELIGPALDWAVANANKALAPKGNLWLHGKQLFVAAPNGDLGEPGEWIIYRPSTDQALGGSIIDREEISTVLLYGTTWGATTYNVQDIVLDRNEAHYQGVGPTRLIAAMRCYVSIKLGDEIELPKELI